MFEVNGTSSSKIADLNLTTSSATGYTSEIISVGSDLMFLAGDTANGSLELWKISGGSASLVKNISAEVGVSGGDTLKGRNIVSAHGKAFFVVDLERGGGLHTQNIWSSDGTLAGTNESIDLNPGLSVTSVDIGSSSDQLTIAADINDDTGKELWVYDSSASISTSGLADCPSTRNPCRVESAPGFPDAKVDVDDILFEAGKFYFNSISSIRTRFNPYYNIITLEKTLSVVDINTKQISYAEFFTDRTDPLSPFYYRPVVSQDLCKVGNGTNPSFYYGQGQLIDAMETFGLSYTGNYAADCSSYASWLSTRSSQPTLGQTRAILTELFRKYSPWDGSPYYSFNYGVSGLANSGVIAAKTFYVNSINNGRDRNRFNVSNLKKHNGIFYVLVVPTLDRGPIDLSNETGAIEVYRKPRILSFANVEPHLIPRVEPSEYPALAEVYHVGGPGLLDPTREVYINYVSMEVSYNQPVKITSKNLTDYSIVYGQTGSVVVADPENIISVSDDYENDNTIRTHLGGIQRPANATYIDRFLHLYVESINGETMYSEAHGGRLPR